jgi:tRNA uracil 4-sulfurtransferase
LAPASSGPTPTRSTSPDLTIVVEVDQQEMFVYDSPVAAYRMMRRGLRCDFLHFSGMPLTGPESVYKAYGLMYQLDRFQGDRDH